MSMWWGLLLALAGAVCAGSGAVLQALAARAIPDRGSGLHAGLVLDLVRQWRFLAGIGLDVVSFFTSFAALRVLPIFIVQAVISANLAVTALVAWRVLGTRLRWIERGAVLAVCLGLVGLGISATRQGTSHGTTTLHISLLATVGLVARAYWATAVVWLFNVWGAGDLLYASLRGPLKGPRLSIFLHLAKMDCFAKCSQ